MMRGYLDRMMTARDKRFRHIAIALGAEDPEQREADALARARAAYKDASGKAPHHSWDIATLEAKTAEARSGSD